MTLPKDLTPLKTRVIEILVSGSGQSPYVISTGSLTLRNWYETRPDTAVAQDALLGQQCRYKLTLNPATGWFKPSNVTLYNVDLEIEVAQRLESPLLDEKRLNVEMQLVNQMPIIARAFEFPQNLRTTDAGLETGLASGRFKYLSADPPSFDYSKSLGTTRLKFTGKLVLSNSLT